MRHHSTVALVLAGGVAISLVALSLAAGFAEASKHSILTAELATLLSTALGAAIGAVATYLGTRPPVEVEGMPEPRREPEVGTDHDEIDTLDREQ